MKASPPVLGSRTAPRRRAFSLMEIIVSSLILITMMIAVLAVFDQSARIARDQSELAVMQQSLRVGHQEMVRFVRMAGAGGIPLTWSLSQLTELANYDQTGAFPRGLAVEVTNNVPEGTMVGGNRVMPGSDILTVRGVFTTPVYYFQQVPVPTAGWVDAGTGFINNRQVTILPTIGLDYNQSLQPLVERLQQMQAATGPNKNVAFILRDLRSPDQYAVLEWNATSTDNVLDTTGTTVVLRLNADSGVRQGAYGELGLGTHQLSTGGAQMVSLPPGLVSDKLPLIEGFGSIGLLEEYRFYLRADWEVPGDPTSRLLPVLVRHQFLPNTNDTVDQVDLVDGMYDMQVAVGFDRDWRRTSADHERITEGDDVTLPRSEDEILFNDPDDFTGASPEPALTAAYFEPSIATNKRTFFHPQLQMSFLRITTVAQSAVPNSNMDAPRLGMIEDSDRGVPFTIEGTSYDLNASLKYRRKMLQTIVELRNLK